MVGRLDFFRNGLLAGAMLVLDVLGSVILTYLQNLRLEWTLGFVVYGMYRYGALHRGIVVAWYDLEVAKTLGSQ